MCFVKTLIHKKPVFQSAFKPCQETDAKSIEEDSTPFQQENSQNNEKNELLSLFQSLLMTNSIALMGISKSIENIVQKMEFSKKQLATFQKSQKNNEITEEIMNIDPQIQTIFGNKKYQFQLKLQEQFPTILYKERNFNCCLRLQDSKGNPVRNANLIPLCMGVSTINGDWIHENKAAESMIKGKNEIDLYQGKAQFQKIYLREVSRAYPEGKFNLIIYAKPSTIRYSNHTALEQHVNQNFIMPLLLKDITVRAKKK